MDIHNITYRALSRLSGNLKRSGLLILTFIYTALAASADSPKLSVNSDLCALSREALSSASAIRELALKVDVPCVVEDKAAVAHFIQETINEDLPPSKLADEELAYRAIGLIPEAFDYQHGLVDLLVSQIGGYYNPKRKLFVMAGWLPLAVQGSVAVHELTHALQDQHFNLGSVMQPKSSTTDSGLAASSLVEGDASAVMFDYERRNAGQEPIKDMASVDSILLLQVLGLGLSRDVPESLTALLIFPYTSGLRFVHAAIRRGGYSELNSVYSRIPKTTREILHPDDYLNREFSPQIPLDSELEGAPSGVVPKYTDVLGEFGISAIFRGVAATKEKGVSAAAGWLGDKIAIFPVSNREQIVSWLTRWESEVEALEFRTAYGEYIRELYQVTLGSNEVALNQKRRIKLTLRGRDVSFVVRESR